MPQTYMLTKKRMSDFQVIRKIDHSDYQNLENLWGHFLDLV